VSPCDFCTTSRAGRLSTEMSVRTGDSAAEIVRDVVTHNADLIVTATHGHSGVTRLVLGSVAAHVLAHGSVLMVLAQTRRPPHHAPAHHSGAGK
jgi:nucleotide-binding universal stress UspA family protein